MWLQNNFICKIIDPITNILYVNLKKGNVWFMNLNMWFTIVIN